MARGFLQDPGKRPYSTAYKALRYYGTGSIRVPLRGSFKGSI